jgi:hypothetical protein
MKNDQLVFRRVKGRIVPIRKKKPENSLGNGLALTGSGLTAVVAGAEAAARTTKGAAALRAASKLRFRAANQILEGTRVGQQAFDFTGNVAAATRARRGASLLRMASIGLRKTRRPVLFGSALLGGAFIGKGLERTYEGATGSQLGTLGEGVTSIAGQGAALLAGGIYYKRLGLPLRSALKYARALRKGTVGNLPKVPIKTPFGPVRFNR